MTIKIVVNGFDVEVSSPEEAAALLGALKKSSDTPASSVTPATPAPKPINGSSSSSDSDSDLDQNTAQMTLKFLKAIRDGGATGGIQSDAVMSALGVTAPKAIGSKSASVNAVLSDVLGLRQKSVYVNPKTANGRFWKPGKKIELAIQQLEQRMAAVH